METESQFQYTVIQGKTRGRARVVKLKDSAALIVADRILKTGKHLMLVRATDSSGPVNNRLVQLHATVERGDDEKRGYVLRLLHAQCPAGLDVLLTFLQEELGLVTRSRAVAEAVNGQSGPVTFRFDTKNFEMGGSKIEEERDEPRPVYRATPAARSVPVVDSVQAQMQQTRAEVQQARAAASRSEDSPIERQRDERSMPDMEGDPDEFISMFGMKVKRGQFDALGDLTYKPGGAGNAVRSAKRDQKGSGLETVKKKKKTGLIERVARKLTDSSLNK